MFYNRIDNKLPIIPIVTQTVCGWEEGGEGVELCLRPFSAGVWHSVCDQIHNLQNCLTTPNQNLGGGGGLRQINTCRKVPFQVTWIAFCQSNLSTERGSGTHNPVQGRHDRVFLQIPFVRLLVTRHRFV
jgi:hypothetical protein